MSQRERSNSKLVATNGPAHVGGWHTQYAIFLAQSQRAHSLLALKASMSRGRGGFFPINLN
eukprot:5921250-Prymnesium_polylepis.1